MSSIIRKKEFFLKIVKKVFQLSKAFANSFLEALIQERIKQADYEIARHLYITEYKNQSFDYIYSMVKNGKILEIEK
jgi:hypothetical protein